MTTASPEEPPRAGLGPWLAFIASAALHGGLLALALSGGGPEGKPDGRRAIAVRLITQDQAAELTGTVPERVEAPVTAEVRSDAGADEREEREAPGAAPDDASATGRVPDARVLESIAAEFEAPRAEGRPGDRPTPAKDGKRSPRALAKAAPRAERDRRRRNRRDRPETPPPDDATETGTAPEGGASRRVASPGTPGARSGPMPPAWREVLVALLQRQIERCYAAPAEAAKGVVLPVLDIRLRPDGTFSSRPRIASSGRSAVDVAIAQAALRAVQRCAPYQIPGQFAPYYEDWKDIRAEFEFSSS